jgi:AcrR family transcriptional regulator
METTDSAIEQKIKEAAKVLFTRQGYDATRTRDIAEIAGVNIALVNYYFKSKQNLFHIIMREKIEMMISIIFPCMNDSSKTLEEKFTLAIEHIFTIMIKDPDLPLFIFSEIQRRPQEIKQLLPFLQNIYNIDIFKQINELQPTINPLHFMLSFFSITIFPFIARPLLFSIKLMTPIQFELFLEERKKMIPLWMKIILQRESVLDNKSEDKILNRS